MDLLLSAGSLAFVALCTGTVLLYVVAHVRPSLVEAHVSIPYVFEVKRNFGAPSFDFQTAIYAVFHRSLFDDVCHHFLVFDQVAWAVVAYAFTGWAGVAVLAAIAIGQALSTGERGLTAAITVCWAGFAALGAWLSGRFGADATAIAELELVGSAVLRVIGHAAEPLPPLVAGETLKFHSLRFRPSLALTFFAGCIAEFASGIPGRLFAPQLDLMLQRFGFRPARTISLADAKARAEELGRDGWLGWEVTRALYANHPAAAEA